MRASSVIVILAILIAAFLAWDAYDNDGQYRKSALNEIEHEMNGVFGR
jgi:phage/plasmid-associated DNA primase